MPELSRLTPVNPRDVWPHEAQDFTPWLLENADALGEALQIDIDFTASEHPVGSFALDIVGNDLSNGCPLIVENQLSGTDHSHLGQLMTYAAGTDAGTVVWIATSFAEPHRQAIDWLNSLGGESVRFFGVEVGAVKIDNSPPAPMFEVKAQPNDWHARVASMTRASVEGGGKGEFYRAFWSKFLEQVRSEHPDWTRARTPQTANWIGMPSPLRGTFFGANFAMGARIRTELYVDTGDAESSLGIFRYLEGRKSEIEGAYGGALSWEELPERRACRIADYGEGDVTNTNLHDQYIDWFFDSGTKLRHALSGPFAATAAHQIPSPPATLQE